MNVHKEFERICARGIWVADVHAGGRQQLWTPTQMRL